MKRRQRKHVLDINGESDSPRRRWPNERHSQNGSPSNPLAELVGQYNSDSETEDGRPRAHALNDQVNDFLKEIQSIAPDNNKNSNSSMQHPGSYWQECFDEQTGYPYYWHTETNQVTWEVPPELKALKEKQSQNQAGTPHGSHIPQWPNMASNKFSQSQSNIPEGMIPKEVVVRNRNRQAGIVNKPAKPPTKPNLQKSPGLKANESLDDEGKIEMITSFGNEESESEESEHEEPQKKSCLKKPPSKSSQIKPPTSSQDQPRKPQSPPQIAGPSLPPMHYGPQNKQKLSDRLSQNISTPKQPSSSSNISSNEEDILQRLKNQAKLLRSNLKNDSSKSHGDKDSKAKDLKLSLVPGYEDDSDGEEESPRKPHKPLFPIPETSSASNDSNSATERVKRLETNAGSIRIYDYRNTEPEDKTEENSNAAESNSGEDKPDESKLDTEAKANKFLESLDPPTKAFQRKRRIAFDVAPSKSKTPDAAQTKEESSSSPNTLPTEPSERRGLGFAKEGTPESESTAKSTSDADGKRNAVAFVKGAKDEESSTSNDATAKTKEITEAEKTEMRGLTEPIMEKLKFLSEGSPAASAVQVMAIQIQTLLCAWESGALQEPYLRNWLVGTGCELTRLEQTAAPPGWECQWDRSHKRYYYRNASTSEAQWTYPEADIAGGAEEMELCTTPPPPEHEEAPIIEMSAQAVALGKDSKESNQSQAPRPPSTEPDEPAVPPPPPPVISSPSPPPPPRIYAEDLKRGKKRKGSPESSSSRNADDTPKDNKPEPLPPGVDPPELAYTLPASALEAGVLYGAQQTNPIYAATLAGAGIPILSSHHPHTALMSGHHLMQYNSAYHQHLHNQALVAARLSGQEAAVAQYMAAEYARVYENNQVIAKPPMKVPHQQQHHHDASLGSVINSFYSDIASIEKSADVEKEKIAVAAATATAAELRPAAESAAVPSPSPQVPPAEADLAGEMKEKKKKKLKTGIGKKQKEMSSMVAKWQKAQKNYKEGH